MSLSFDVILESTGAALTSFVDSDGVFNFIVPEATDAQPFRVVVRVPTIVQSQALLSVHGESGNLRFRGSPDGCGGSIVVIREHRDNFLAFAPTRVDNDVLIDGDGLQRLQLGALAVEVFEHVDTIVVPSQPSKSSSQPISCNLPTSLKLPEKAKKAMLNAMTIVSAGQVPKAPSSSSRSTMTTQSIVRSVGVLRGFYSTAMGHFLRKKLPLELVHMAIPARTERAEVIDDDDVDDAGNAPNKRRLLSSATAKRPKSEPKTEQGAQVKAEPTPAVAASSSSAATRVEFKVLEDGVLDLT